MQRPLQAHIYLGFYPDPFHCSHTSLFRESVFALTHDTSISDYSESLTVRSV